MAQPDTEKVPLPIQCPLCGFPEMGYQEHQPVSYTVVKREGMRIIVSSSSEQKYHEGDAVKQMLYCPSCDGEVVLNSEFVEFE